MNYEGTKLIEKLLKFSLNFDFKTKDAIFTTDEVVPLVNGTTMILKTPAGIIKLHL